MKLGDIAWKRANAGFVGERLLVRIVEAPSGPCMAECGAPHCEEYANVAVLDEATREEVGYCYHVSECQLEPVGE